MKKTIAVDVDDVLAASAEGWVKYSNETWGTNLKLEDYQEDWAQTWGVDYDESERRATIIHETGVMDTYGHFPDAKEVLTELAESYRLVVTTSRMEAVREGTIAWLDQYYGGIFEDVHLAGFYDKGNQYEGLQMTKAGLLQSIGADYLIDDQPKHCFAAAEVGMEALLFGDYKWNRALDTIPKGVVWCKNWAEVKKFFDGIR